MTTETFNKNQTIAGNYWLWQGHNIYYVQAGDKNMTKPALLLVHGFGASTDHWRKNIAQLQDNFEVWAIDLLGFGRSAKPNIAYGGDLWQQQLTDFIKEVIQKPTVLAGNSLGGYASLCAAAKDNLLIAGLILINSAGPFSDQKTVQPSLLGKLTKTILLQPWASYLLFQYTRRKSVIRKTLEKVYLDKNAVTEQLIEDIYRPSSDKGAAQVFASVFKTPQGEKIDILLQQLKCPLLMLWGEGDPWINAKEKGAKFRQYYPSLTEYYLKAGHCPHDEIPDEVNNLITNWIINN
jgi:pimeloyl-ACP methyl ester carboxylesterase